LLDEQSQNDFTDFMALRVLLADESSTIKKVFQLALQDFAVEVRPVNVGVDVITVSESFKPDIIFADVLLQKRNGYDVAADLKQNAGLQDIPIVLMWSGFMEFDEDKFQASNANAKLEKPFDVAALRKLVTELVPRTQGQRLSQFLTFPKMPDFAEKGAATSAAASVGADPGAPPAVPVSKSSQAEDFQQVSIPKMKGVDKQKDKYKLDLKPEEMDPNHIPVEYDERSLSVNTEDLFGSSEEDDTFQMRETHKAPVAKPPTAKPPPAPSVPEPPPLTLTSIAAIPPAAPAPAAAPAAVPKISEAELERIIRAQSAEVIEAVVWKVIPELAAQIIERELNKLLKERDAHPF